MSNKSILQSNNDALSANNLDLQSLIDQANALPDADGVELPELTNEGSAADLMLGKELIDADGSKVTGTFSIDTELATQDELIAQIQATVNNLPEANIEGVCPSLTIQGNALYTDGGIFLHKVAYYSNGKLQTLTAYNDQGFECGIDHNLIEQPYIIQNIDIGKPIIIEGRHQAHDTAIDDISDNINIIFESLRVAANLRVIVFTITDTSSAFITLIEN